MSLSRALTVSAATLRQAQREMLLWTTRDGREIPLDEMSCDHIANAVRVLSLWRSRLKKRDADDSDSETVRDLANAISRFKLIQRQRRKLADRATRDAPDEGEPSVSQPDKDAPTPQARTSNFKQPRETSPSTQSSPRSTFSRRRKPVAST